MAHCDDSETVIDVWRLAFRRDVARRALLTAVLVGTILTAINQGPGLLALDPPPAAIWQIPLTYLVPWLVSTWSALAVLRTASAGDRP